MYLVFCTELLLSNINFEAYSRINSETLKKNFELAVSPFPPFYVI